MQPLGALASDSAADEPARAMHVMDIMGTDGMHFEEVDANSLSSELREALGLS